MKNIFLELIKVEKSTKKTFLQILIGLIIISICFPINAFLGQTLFCLLVFVVTGIHLFIIGKQINFIQAVEIVLSYFLFFFIGFAGIWAFTGHLFLADEVAKRIGWPIGSPFQTELGFVGLAFGIIGFMSFWFKKEFKLATAISRAIFLLGAAYTHIREMIISKNFSELNTGYILWMNDIILPVIMLALAIIYFVAKKDHEAG